MAVGASGFPSAVDAQGALMLVKAGAAHTAAGISNALCWVAEALASRVMVSDCRLLVNRLGELASIEQPERADWAQEGDNPRDLAHERVGSMLGRAAASWALLGLCLNLFSNKLSGGGDSAPNKPMHSGQDTWHSVIVPDFWLLDSCTMQNLQNGFGALLGGEEIPGSKVRWSNCPPTAARRDHWD